MRKIIIASFGLLLVLTACKKYEDGPGFSLRSKLSRMHNVWEFDEALIDDVVVELSDSMTCEFLLLDVTLTRICDCTIPGLDNYDATWKFEDSKESLTVSPRDGSSRLGMFLISDKWTITKLKKKELWLKYTDALNTYRIKYKTLGS